MKPLAHSIQKKALGFCILIILSYLVYHRYRPHFENPQDHPSSWISTLSTARILTKPAPKALPTLKPNSFRQPAPSAVSKQFQALQPKVLKTDRELAQFHSDLESREQMSLALGQLVQIPDENPSDLDAVHQNREQRMAAIDWIDEALSWKDNPRRNEIIEKVIHLISRDISSLTLHPEIKHTLAGDKIELIGLIATSEPRLASKLQEAARGSKDIKLFQYAKSMYGIDF